MTDDIKKVFCIKLKSEQDALPRAPVPGELGERILANVSQQAWREWLDHQTMLINEKKLSPREKSTREYLAKQTEAHFFGDGAEAAEGYVAPKGQD